MGGGSYSYDGSMKRRAAQGWSSRKQLDKAGIVTDDSYRQKGINEVFRQRQLESKMNPFNVLLRESRDSAEHPESLAVVIALDVTGSMGTVPHHLVQEGLPHIMKKLIDSGIPHPQVLFTAVGDHRCDAAPFQVGQFESSDELLDQWLTSVFLEGNGGGNGGESYPLAWYFAGQRTAIDCMEKRQQKGFMFTIGDENYHDDYDGRHMKEMFGDQSEYPHNATAAELLAKAREKYEIFHIHIAETSQGHDQHNVNRWRELVGPNLLVAERHTQVADMIAEAILRTYKARGAQAKETEKPSDTVTPVPDKPIPSML